MPEELRTLKRKVTIEFAPDRSDPYGLDYKISFISEMQASIVRLSFKELEQLQQQIEDLHRA